MYILAVIYVNKHIPETAKIHWGSEQHIQSIAAYLPRTPSTRHFVNAKPTQVPNLPWFRGADMNAAMFCWKECVRFRLTNKCLQTGTTEHLCLTERRAARASHQRSRLPFLHFLTCGHHPSRPSLATQPRACLLVYSYTILVRVCLGSPVL